jgi:mitochondrial distribution and morphology protein 34
MFLRLSSFQLSGIIILVFSKQKGLTLVFRNDPVDSVNVSSTFDSIPAIQKFLQAEIERLLKDLMREEVPAIIHKLSLEWAMRHQADECLSPASLINTQPETASAMQNYPYSLDIDANDPLRPILSTANLNRLSELSLAQHTLSPFTASIPESVFRSSTSLIASLQHKSVRRYELPFFKSCSEAGPPFQRNMDISPPESVHSAQSADPSTRPVLYGHRRTSHLRRTNPPKRKIIRLNARSECDSPALSETSEIQDSFSDPGGYSNVFQSTSWNEKSPLKNERWSYSNWETTEPEKDHKPWTNDFGNVSMKEKNII